MGIEPTTSRFYSRCATTGLIYEYFNLLALVKMFWKFGGKWRTECLNIKLLPYYTAGYSVKLKKNDVSSLKTQYPPQINAKLTTSTTKTHTNACDSSTGHEVTSQPSPIYLIDWIELDWWPFAANCAPPIEGKPLNHTGIFSCCPNYMEGSHQILGFVISLTLPINSFRRLFSSPLLFCSSLYSSIVVFASIVAKWLL